MLALRLCLLSVLAVPALLAQIGTSTFTGRITDGTGAVVANARVTVVQKETNFTFNAVSNAEGIYRVPSLNPGTYRMTVEANGFKKTVRDDVELRSSDTVGVDFALQIGNVAESIEVSSAVTSLETETSTTGATMTGSVLYDMPLYQRYVNSTLNLVPGMSSGGYAYGGSLGSYHLAGQRNGAIGIFEDGVNGNDQQGGTETIKPLQNAVAEVKVITTVPRRIRPPPPAASSASSRNPAPTNSTAWAPGTAAPAACSIASTSIASAPRTPRSASPTAR